MTMAEYLALPAVNAGLLVTLLEECAASAWYQSWLNPNPPPPDDTKESDIGTLAHGIVLEGSRDRIAVIDPIDYPSKTGTIPKGWTNDAIKAARDNARAEGKIPLLPDTALEVDAMAQAVQMFIASLRDSEPEIWAMFQPDGGKSEQTFVWQDQYMEASVDCKIRPDRINTACTRIVDLKFSGVSAEPDHWARQMFRMNYYTSAAFYRRGIKKLFREEIEYTFLVCESRPPYLCSLVGVDPAAFALGGAKVDSALAMWRKCVALNQWPGYPPRVCFPDLPAWEGARWEERQAMEQAE